MPRVAILLDGAEAARQRFADVTENLESCRRSLASDGYTSYAFEYFSDEEAGRLVDLLGGPDWSCLVLASNALRSAEVANIIRRRSVDLHRFIRRGGGVVVLHQIAASLTPLLPNDLAPPVSARVGGELVSARAIDGADVLLRYPEGVAVAHLRDLSADEIGSLRLSKPTSELASFFFTMYPRSGLPPSLKPVLVAADDQVLLARTPGHRPERIVLTTIPLDWQGAHPSRKEAACRLLENAIRYAAVGEPNRLVWRDDRRTTDELLRRWLAVDGRSAIHVVPPEDAVTGAADRWLLSHVDVLFAPEDRPDVETRPEVVAFLESGGTMVAVGSVPVGTRATTTIGRYEERTLATRLYAELRAVSGWDTLASAFAIRSIVGALCFLWRDKTNQSMAAAISPSSLPQGLHTEIRKRLGQSQHREDFGSSIALVQTLSLLAGPLDAELTDWIGPEGSLREFDVVLQVEATLAHAARRVVPGYLKRVAEELDSKRDRWESLGPIVRVLDALALLGYSGLLPDPEAQSANDAVVVGDVVSDALDRFQATPSRGWMSVDATADVVLGLVALREHLPQGSRARERTASHVATGVGVLRLARGRYERDVNGVAWLAHLTHALVVADREFPLGLQRLASLDWPDVAEEPITTRHDRALLEQLALGNEHLRERAQRVDQDLTEALRRNESERGAARVGRATATLVPVVLLVGACALLLREIGWGSIPLFLANAAALASIGLAVTTGIFAWLSRRNLLAGPAGRVHGWIQAQGLNILKSGGSIKTK